MAEEGRDERSAQAPGPWWTAVVSIAFIAATVLSALTWSAGCRQLGPAEPAEVEIDWPDTSPPPLPPASSPEDKPVQKTDDQKTDDQKTDDQKTDGQKTDDQKTGDNKPE